MSDEIKKMLGTKRLIIGTDRTLKHLRSGDVEKIFLSNNCPKTLKEDINHYSAQGGVKVVELSVPNEELGVLCKKPFPVSVVSVLKGK